MRVFLVASESSADQLGADVIRALRASHPDMDFVGVGGTAMASEGVESLLDLSPLAVLGLWDGLKAYGDATKLADTMVDLIEVYAPDAVILIDAWGFTIRVAKQIKMRELSPKVIKLIGPQVWAMRAGRAKTLARWVDYLLCINPFEYDFYLPFDLPVEVIGNPALGRSELGDGNGFRKRHNIAAHEEVILLAPGSRSNEIRRMEPVLSKAAAQLLANNPNRKFICILSSSVADIVKKHAEFWPFPVILVEEPHKFDAMNAADIALVCSGTVTTEIAIQRTPMLVGYKLDWLTYLVGRCFRLYKPEHITLFNIIANKPIAEEFLQLACNPENFVRAAEVLLADSERRQAQIQAQSDALSIMGLGDEAPAQKSANAITKWLMDDPRQ